jgi:hypothetical protein
VCVVRSARPSRTDAELLAACALCVGARQPRRLQRKGWRTAARARSEARNPGGTLTKPRARRGGLITPPQVLKPKLQAARTHHTAPTVP